MLDDFGKLLVALGLFMLIVGIVVIALSKVNFVSFPIGKLPGDILIKRGNFTFYFPVTTSILISIIISVILFVVSNMVKR